MVLTGASLFCDEFEELSVPVAKTSSSPSSASLWIVEDDVVDPSVRSSIALRTPLSKARASAGL